MPNHTIWIFARYSDDDEDRPDLEELEDVGDHDGHPGEGGPDDPGHRLTGLIPREAVPAPVETLHLALAPRLVFLLLLNMRNIE